MTGADVITTWIVMFFACIEFGVWQQSVPAGIFLWLLWVAATYILHPILKRFDHE